MATGASGLAADSDAAATGASVDDILEIFKFQVSNDKWLFGVTVS